MDEVELALRMDCIIGESPFWAADESALYWIDIKAPALFRLHADDAVPRSWDLPAEIGAFALEIGGTALVALRTGLFRLVLADGGLTLLAPPPFDPALFRFNEGKCDRSGRFWVGVMFDPEPGCSARPQHGGLHVWSEVEGLRPVPDRAELHNGMAWNVDESRFLVSHSQQGAIWDYPFDAATGRLGAGRLFARIPPEDGIPDGAAIDATGGYWCAMHGGWRLRRFHPDGRFDRDVALPVSQPTMPCFGGPELDLLFVTSASDGLDDAARKREPLAGSLFRLRPGIAGLPAAALGRRRGEPPQP